MPPASKSVVRTDSVVRTSAEIFPKRVNSPSSLSLAPARAEKMVVKVADAPYRPTPWSESCNFWFWATNNEALTAPDLPGFSYTEPANAPTNRARLDLSQDRAWENRRFWGSLAVRRGHIDYSFPSPFPFLEKGGHRTKTTTASDTWMAPNILKSSLFCAILTGRNTLR